MIRFLPYRLTFAVALQNRGWVSTGQLGAVHDHIFGFDPGLNKSHVLLRRLQRRGIVRCKASVPIRGRNGGEERNLWCLTAKGDYYLNEALSKLPKRIYLRVHTLAEKTQV